MDYLPPLPPTFAALAPDFAVPDPSDAPSLRWGIIGAGGIARVFAQTVPQYSTQVVTAIGSRSLPKAQKFAAELGIPSAYGSYLDLVNSDDVDIVYIATPHSHHAEVALLALQAGKPVLVEKAFTVNRAEAEEIFDAAQSRQLFVMEAMWSRHLPHYHYLRALQRGGQVGVPVAVHGDHGQLLTHVPRLMRPELGGGALLDLGVYPLHLMQMVLGDPSAVHAAGRLTATGVDAAETIIGSYPNALGTISANLDGISATAGSVTFELASFEMPNQFYRPGKVTLRTFAPGTPELYGEAETWDARVPGGFQFQAAEAARCVAAGLTQSPVMPWKDTLAVMSIIDQAREQIETER